MFYLYVPRSIVPNISAKKTSPPLNTDSSQEFELKARAASHLFQNIINKATAPNIDPHICENI
jgi:hypothetical protein